MAWRSFSDWISFFLATARITVPALKLAIRYVDDGDRWNAVVHHVPLRLFARACRRDFDWYFEGESELTIETVPEICAWLSDCNYVNDQEFVRKRGFWQHPLTFEEVRRGNCVDHALWAWTRLSKLKFPARFIVGEWLPDGDGELNLHAWVVFEDGNKQFVLEGVADDPEKMIQPLEDMRQEYIPHFSVDERFERKIYAGYLETKARQRRIGKKK